jgi:hypothetical protein
MILMGENLTFVFVYIDMATRQTRGHCPTWQMTFLKPPKQQSHATQKHNKNIRCSATEGQRQKHESRFRTIGQRQILSLQAGSDCPNVFLHIFLQDIYKMFLTLEADNYVHGRIYCFAIHGGRLGLQNLHFPGVLRTCGNMR